MRYDKTIHKTMPKLVAAIFEVPASGYVTETFNHYGYRGIAESVPSTGEVVLMASLNMSLRVRGVRP